jgi:hypothetical protein
LIAELTRLALSKNKLKERKQQMKNKADISKHKPSFTVVDIVYVYRPVVSPGRQRKFISSKIKIVERGKIDTPSTQIHDRSFLWYGTGISINSGGVKSALRAQVSALHEMMRYASVFHIVSKMLPKVSAGRIRSSCSTSSTRRTTLVANQMISHE